MSQSRNCVGPPPPPRPPARGRRRRFLLAAVYLAWLAVVGWGGLTFFWWWRFGVPVNSTPGVETVWESFYPELYRSGVMDAKLAPNDGHYDVLLLGGSVLEQAAAEVVRALRRGLC